MTTNHIERKYAASIGYFTFQGKTFVITGKIPGYNRTDIIYLICQCGGKVDSTVTLRTDYLIVGASPGQTKLNKASKYAVQEISLSSLIVCCNKEIICLKTETNNTKTTISEIEFYDW